MFRQVIALGIALMFGTTLQAFAKDYVVSQGPLSNQDFYNLVSCAAPPSKPCAQPRYAWRKTNLSVGIIRIDDTFGPAKRRRAHQSLVDAVAQINALPLSVSLRIVTRGSPNVAIYLLDIPKNSRIQDRSLGRLNGVKVGKATTQIETRGGRIRHAAIAFSRNLHRRHFPSVMLEELVQSLGLITDIRNPYYNTRSILSQDGDNLLKTLGAQDIMALQKHYPLR